MTQLGNVGIGKLFVYNNGLFVVTPFDWNAEKYFNLCIATRNRDDYEVGDYYEFDERIEVHEISTAVLKGLLIPKDLKEF